jgi:hypothetical protein
MNHGIKVTTIEDQLALPLSVNVPLNVPVAATDIPSVAARDPPLVVSCSRSPGYTAPAVTVAEELDGNPSPANTSSCAFAVVAVAPLFGDAFGVFSGLCELAVLSTELTPWYSKAARYG